MVIDEMVDDEIMKLWDDKMVRWSHLKEEVRDEMRDRLNNIEKRERMISSTISSTINHLPSNHHLKKPLFLLFF